MARSEQNKVGNTKYPDLPMTHYPLKLDSRVEGDLGYNPNMKGFENLKDYSMAEHVNALSDAVMAIQRSLGITPAVDVNGVDHTTLDTRLDVLESKDYDARYGGVGWDTSQVLVSHTHTGKPGSPSKINLASEVQGLLNLEFINVNPFSPTGLTAEDIMLSSNSTVPIRDAVNDKLTISTGGVVKGPMTLQNRFKTRNYWELDQSYVSSALQVADATGSTGKIARATGTVKTTFLSQRGHLMYGHYVLMARLRLPEAVTTTGTVATIQLDSVGGDGTPKTIGTLNLVAADFPAAGTWKTFYLVGEHTAVQGKYAELQVSVSKALGDATAFAVDFDYAVVTPTHPAIYDK